MNVFNTYILIVFISLFGAAHYLAAQTTDEIFEEGQFALSADDYISALSLFESCFEQDSLRLDCLELLASTQHTLGMMAGAKVSYLRLAEDSIFAFDSWRRLASIYELEENAPKAIKYYTLLTKKDTLNPYFFRKLGQLYQNAGLNVDAFSHYGRALSLNRADIQTIKGLAEIFIDNQQNTLADSLLHHALILDPSNNSLKLLLSRSLYGQRAYAKVAVILKEVFKDVGLNNYFNKMLGYTYLQIDSVEQAVFYLQASLVNENNPEYAEYYLAIAHDRLGDQQSAQFFFERALNSGISKNTPIYHRQLAKIAQAKGKTKEAIDHYQRSLDYNLDGMTYYHLATLAEVYYKDVQVAIKYYNQYLSSDHEDAQIRDYVQKKIYYLKEKRHMER